jgi:hypothetical protein
MGLQHIEIDAALSVTRRRHGTDLAPFQARQAAFASGATRYPMSSLLNHAVSPPDC